MFPIVDAPNIPFELIEPFRVRVFENHGMTLENLMKIGGVTASEAIDIMLDKKWNHTKNEADAVRFLHELVCKRMKF